MKFPMEQMEDKNNNRSSIKEDLQEIKILTTEE